ncbi:MAG: hypothetical protein ABI361_01920 [Nitrososphaera sp.]
MVRRARKADPHETSETAELLKLILEELRKINKNLTSGQNKSIQERGAPEIEDDDELDGYE